MLNIPVHIRYTMSHVYHPLPVPATHVAIHNMLINGGCLGTVVHDLDY